MKWAKHVHHDILIEPLIEPIEVRQDFIKLYKPPGEVPIRLSSLAEIDWDLPSEVVKAGEALGKVWEASVKTRKAYIEQAYDKTGYNNDSKAKARETHLIAEEVYEKTRKAYVKVLRNNQKVIESLHAKKCPNCPWDGQTILPPNKEITKWKRTQQKL